MAEEKKKPKIDLKARLGKTVQGTAVPGGLTPVPPAAGATPIPISDGAGGRSEGTPVPPPAAVIAPPPSIKPSGIAPPPGIAGGIALPPFARQPAPKKEVVSAEQQTIKVEVGEEVIEQRRKGVRNVIIAAVFAAAAGIGIGFVAGGRSEASKNADKAITGSSDLEKEVNATAKKLKELDQMLADVDSLSTETYPADLSQKLAKITIQFDDSKISGPAVGNLPSKVIKQLLYFKQQCDSVQDRKEALKNMLTDKTKADLEKAWADQKKPPFVGSVIFKLAGDGKTIAEAVNNKTVFSPGDKDWPAEYDITVKENKDGKLVDTDKKVTRWVKGDLTGVEGKTMSVPLDPGAHARGVVADIVGPLMAQVAGIKRILYGDNTPDHEVKPLLKPDENTKGVADELEAALTDISLKK